MNVEEVKYPKLLPRTQHFTDVIIESYYRGLLHAGVTHTLCQLRHEYWIPDVRTQIQESVTQMFYLLSPRRRALQNATDGTLAKIMSQPRLFWTVIYQREWKDPDACSSV